MFDKSLNYDSSAYVQKEIAFDLAKAAEVQISASKLILDLGCGTGFVSKAIKSINSCAVIEGVDISPFQLLQAKPFYNKLWQGDITTFEASKKYDIILSSMCLQWIKDKNDVIAKYSPFFFTLPTPNSLHEIKECFKQINKPSPILEFEMPSCLQPFKKKIYKQKFNTLLKALKYFNHIGAVKNKENQIKISHNEIKDMEKYFTKIVTWEIAFFSNC